MASETKEKKIKKKEKEEQIQSKSLGNFHNLELLCKADDR
jgi:tubulin monoglycylase TTLL3/8